MCTSTPLSEPSALVPRLDASAMFADAIGIGNKRAAAGPLR
jgi:hypothetical protein